MGGRQLAWTDITFREVIAEWLVRRRGDQRQHDFGRAVGINQTVLSALERGARGVRADHIDTILSQLKLDILDFLQEVTSVAYSVRNSRARAAGRRPTVRRARRGRAA
jgi:hypothetical protein